MATAAETKVSTMRAAVVTDAGAAAIKRVALPEPGPGQVRVRIEGCGVCGSDVPVWQGREWFDYPREPGAPGHEGWGVVDALGDGVTDVEVGTRVACLGSHSYAEFDVAERTALVPLPAELDDVPFPGEALGCAVNVFRRSDVHAGQTVAVVGAGFLGSLLIQIAARAGARVIAVSRRAAALDVATAMGAADTVLLADDAVTQVESLTAGGLCDRVIEAAGKQQTLDISGQLTRVRGRLVIAGFHQDGPRTVDLQLWNWRGLDVVNAHERDPAVYIEGVTEAARLVAAGELDPAPLYTHRLPLERIADAFTTAVERPDGFMKALVLA